MKVMFRDSASKKRVAHKLPVELLSGRVGHFDTVADQPMVFLKKMLAHGLHLLKSCGLQVERPVISYHSFFDSSEVRRLLVIA